MANQYQDGDEEPESNDISSFFDNDEVANPADEDGLEEENKLSFESEKKETAIPFDKPDTEKLYQAESSAKQSFKQQGNLARFLDRQKILLVIFGTTIIIILICIFVIPLFQGNKKNKTDMLDKRGTIYIPDQITKWNPTTQPKEKEVLSPSINSNTQSAESGNFSNKDVDRILAELPYADEARVAPVPVQQSSNGSSSVSGSSRPDTNRNEQQKNIPRMAMTDNGFNSASTSKTAIVPGMNNQGSSSYMSSQSYEQYANERMNNLISGQGTYGNAGNVNSYELQNNQNNKQAFQSANAGTVKYQWNNEYTMEYGTIIPAALVTGINTDLPGIVIARVTSNVYSRDGQNLLIPVGTRVFATYNSSVSYGQNKVQVAWNKLIRPDGLEIDLGNFVGVDAQGYAGYKGNVNNHPFEYIKALGLIAAFSILDTKFENLSTAQNNLYAQNVIADTYSEINKMTGKIVDKALDIQPTITIAQGTEINIITNVTMTFPPAEMNTIQQKYIRMK